VPISEAVSDSAIVWAARQVVRQHVEPVDADRATGLCAQCRDAGCDLLVWAKTVVAADGLAHPRT